LANVYNDVALNWLYSSC